MGTAQADLRKPDEDQPKFSEDTIAGLSALKAEMEKKKMTEEPEKKREPVPDTKPEPEQKPETPPTETAAQRIADSVDELELARISQRIQKDAINNEEERKAVEERIKARGYEMSIEDGLTTGIYTQIVPITDTFTVHYRSLAPQENREIRLWLWNLADEDPRLENLLNEMYGMALIVAAVTQIQGHKLPEHFSREGENKFDHDVFTLKYGLLDTYPSPMIHAIGVHANWFDQRVRRLFTTENLQDF
jgi:hypothetical protein